MKLSASINFFNSEETFLKAVESIRPLVDHLSVIYQNISNCGNPISQSALDVLTHVRMLGLVDDWVQYQPDLNLCPSDNEFLKRNIGLNCAKKNAATHFLLMDADEFYIREEFERAKKIIIDENIDYSSVSSYFYLHSPLYRSKAPDTTNVCFIININKNISFKKDQNFPIESVDPTRRMTVVDGNFKNFEAHEIAMHHMNFVRRNFTSKLANTSSASNTDFIEKARLALNSWVYPDPFTFPNKPVYEIIKVDNLFGISENIFEATTSSKLHHQDANNQKTILICTLRLQTLAGSEIVTLEITKWFLANHWNVYIFTSIYDYPLKLELDTLGSNLQIFTNPQHSDLINLYEKLDLCWVQHQCLPESFIDYLIQGNRKPFMVFNHMSSFEYLEFPIIQTAETELADIIYTISNEASDTLTPYFLQCRNKILLFQNPAPSNYFTLADNSHGSNQHKKVSRVLVVSNHCPDELMTMANRLHNQGVLVNFVGINQKLQPICSPELLSNYDVVISIGKTVQYCIAMRKPIYIYDHFGGDGYLNINNFKINEQHNFSGRPFPRKSAEQIVKELILGYEEAYHFLQQFDDKSLDRFSLDTQLKKLIAHINQYKASPVNDTSYQSLNLIKAYSRNIRLFCIESKNKEIQIKEMNTERCELYRQKEELLSEVLSNRDERNELYRQKEELLSEVLSNRDERNELYRQKEELLNEILRVQKRDNRLKSNFIAKYAALSSGIRTLIRFVIKRIKG